LWCLTAVSVLGAFVSAARPKYVAPEAGEAPAETPTVTAAGTAAGTPAEVPAEPVLT
jgi:hypothetical protein